MKTLDTIAGHTYVVSSPNGGTVTSADGLVKETVDAGKQKVVFGTGAPLQLDDDAGKIMATFKLAPAALLAPASGGSGGGGAENKVGLSTKCMQVEFLESTGKQYMDLRYIADSQTGLKLTEYRTALEGTYSMGSRNGDTESRFYVPGQMAEKTIFYGWGLWVTKTITSTPSKKVTASLNWKNSNIAKWGDYSYELGELGFEPNLTLHLFGANYTNPGLSKTRIYEVEISHGEEVVRSLVPALSQAGEPCMFDKVTKAQFYNSSTVSFIVGMTLSQALKLSTLPATGGALTVSLPSGYDSDSGVMSALETARSNGWTLTVQTYEAETAATTFGMRRIWVRHTADGNGMYVDADGNRWQVDWCVTMYTPDGSEPDAHGYELFRSVDAAVAYWELEPYVDPETEKLLTENTTNE